METFEHDGKRYVRGEPIPVGHPALPMGAVYLVQDIDGTTRPTVERNKEPFMRCEAFFFAVPVPDAPAGHEIIDFREINWGQDHFLTRDGKYINEPNEECSINNDPYMGRKRFILKKIEQPTERKCPGCGITQRQTAGGYYSWHETDHRCPWELALMDTSLKDLAGQEYADAHWREHWTPKVGDYVHTANGDSVFQLDRIRNEYVMQNKSEFRPAYPGEILRWSDPAEAKRAGAGGNFPETRPCPGCLAKQEFNPHAGWFVSSATHAESCPWLRAWNVRSCHPREQSDYADAHWRGFVEPEPAEAGAAKASASSLGAVELERAEPRESLTTPAQPDMSQEHDKEGAKYSCEQIALRAEKELAKWQKNVAELHAMQKIEKRLARRRALEELNGRE